MERRMYNKKNQIVGTWCLFDEMDDITLAYNLGDLTNEELKRVPYIYIKRWESWREGQAKNSYWNSPLHC